MTELALIFGGGLLGLAFAAYLARWVVLRPLPEPEVARVASLIQGVAEAFFRRQSGVIGAVSAAAGGAIFLAYGLLRGAGEKNPVPALELGVWLTVSFAIGAASSVATGRIATWTATRTSTKAASGARRSLDLALQIAMRGGAVSALFVAGISLLGLGGLFSAVFALHGGFGAEPGEALALVPTLPWVIAGYPLGASFAALLAQLGGGTFAKAADLGADIAGAELGLADDDLQNPATLVDLAGDAVGDAAARAAGLLATIAAESMGAMVVGAMVFRVNEGLPSALALVLFPLVACSFGLVAAVFGVMVVRTDDRENAFNALVRGIYITALLHAVGVAGAAKWLLGEHWIALFACGCIGIGSGVLLLHITQYYTEQRYRPVREVAEAARGGPALITLRGLSIGLESSVTPLILVVLAAFGAYWLGARTGLVGGGLFGIAVAAMGLLGISGYMLAMDALGSIVDSAGGIVAVTVGRERPDVRGRTLVLDAVGNTAKAATKVYASGATALASVLLIAAYLDESRRRANLPSQPGFTVRLDGPEVYLGALVGILLVLWLAGRCIRSVLQAVRRVVDEVRRQATNPPPGFIGDHEPCVEMVSRAALRQMIWPAVISASAPIAVGLVLRFARTEDNPLVAVDSVAALLVAGTVAGVLGSLLLGSTGATWDNAKKYIVTGAHGGRYLVDEAGARADNPTYGAAAVGDAVGDPLKDAAGPAIHVLVKLLPAVTIVFLPFFI
ncbi:proton/sodium-translocating pyrophosphatase [Chondromyces apiculatus]|uniref:K(+)-insensitive pyrophosphate-energized proton pump n=1 Tax=Chondromyces apiculatus DSM 436 TaxID=1192034 RepID=A0A017SWL5_9BACT|nr:sodium/proton-translocating pyrophosphatase [Chondromyces apiculatus]EYF00706.1 Pyrophosphate-energized proton pump [Chondromyces apiculatus DSM 436]